MKAYVIRKFGPPSVLQVQEVPEPVPAENEVLVSVRCIGLNFADVFARLGIYPGIPDPPFTPGIEYSGIIRNTGGKVRGLKRGDRVMGFSRQGAYAEVVRTSADQVIRIPAGMKFSEAAAFPVAYLSAYHGLVTLAHAQRGERLLLHAAAGGVGLAALQIAKHLGLETFATVGSREKADIVSREGAGHILFYREEDFARSVKRATNGSGVDVVMDSVGGSVFRKSWKLMAPMGRYVLYGFAAVTSEGGLNRGRMLKEALQVPLLYPPSMVSRNVSLMGFNLYFLAHKTAYLHRAAQELLQWRKRNIIRPYVGRTFEFNDLPRAHEYLQSRNSVGKVVVEVRS